MSAAPTSPTPPERLLDLLADRATQGLSKDEARELDQLLAEHPAVDAEAYDLAAAAAYLAMNGPAAEPMPAAVRARVAETAAARLAEVSRPPARPAPTYAPPPEYLQPPPGYTWPAYSGWLAAVASMAVAVAAWWPATLATHESQRQRMMARAGVVTVPFLDSESNVPVDGDVVWDPAAQSGYVRFINCLPANDPAAEVYQLWLFDATRDERFPVCGGIFSIPEGGEAIIPIRPSLPVRDVSMIAVTVEPPGGVWVSDRSRQPLIARLKD